MENPNSLSDRYFWKLTENSIITLMQVSKGLIFFSCDSIFFKIMRRVKILYKIFSSLYGENEKLKGNSTGYYM